MLGGDTLVLPGHLILLAVTIAPILFVEIPPLTDLPNHLARLHILANIGTEPALQQNYQVSTALTPNVLVDWILTPLVRIWDVYDVGRLFVVATMVVTYLGVLLLSAQFFSRLTLWPALALPILYNHAFSWGFLNFSFGIGIALLSFALWLRLEIESVWRNFCILLVLSVILYLTHMMAFGTFAVIVSAYRLSVAHARGELWNKKFLARFAVGYSPFALAFLVFYLWLGEDGLVGERITAYGDLNSKIRAILSPTMFTGRLEDLLLFLVYLVLAISLIWQKRLILARNTGAPLLCLAAISMAMPLSLFGIWGVDFRLPPVLLMLAIAATRPTGVDGPTPGPAISTIVCLMVVVRVATLWPQLEAADEQFVKFREASKEIPEGARVLATLDVTSDRLALPSKAYWHLVLLAVIERNVFVPFIFTGTAQLRPSPHNRLIDTPSGHIMTSQVIAEGLNPNFVAKYGYKMTDAHHRIYWAEWHKNFDYLVRINLDQEDYGISEYLSNTKKYNYFEISAVKKPDAADEASQ